MQDKTKYQVKCRIKKGDQVIITAGKSKGQAGKVERVDRKTGTVYISGLNTARKHTKPSVASPNGGIIDKVMPLFMSKVALQDPTTKKPTRVSYKKDGERKTRVAVKSKTVLS